MSKYSDHVALVTGGGSGIGRSVVLRFIQMGAAVVIADRAVDQGQALADEISNNGGRALFVKTDVSSEEQVDGLVAAALARFGRLDWAANTAGVPQGGGIYCSKTERDLTVAVNIQGVFYSVAAEARAMIKAGNRGSIVNVSSVFGTTGLFQQPYYSASKHAVIGFTKSCALELADFGIRINCLCPGLTRSAMTEGFFGSSLDAAATALIPIGRIGEPTDQANAVAWLCSDEASFVTGAVLHVDGGQSAGLGRPSPEAK